VRQILQLKVRIKSLSHKPVLVRHDTNAKYGELVNKTAQTENLEDGQEI
jgi:hypothetical protein